MPSGQLGTRAARDASPGRRWPRPARLRPRRHPTGVDAVDWAGLRHDHQRGRLHGCRRGRDHGGRRDALGGERHAVARLAQIASRHQLTARARLDRLRLRRDTASCTTRTSRSRRSASTARPRPPATPCVTTVPRHYIVRTSWVVGDGHELHRTMASLADRGVSPAVVDDQFGRLTFADDIAAGRRAPGDRGASSAPTTSQLGRPVLGGHRRDGFRGQGTRGPAVTRVSTEEYAAGKRVAPRPRHSTLDLSKVVRPGSCPGMEPKRSQPTSLKGDVPLPHIVSPALQTGKRAARQ